MIEALDQERCNRCGYCLEVCPSDVFRHDPVTGRYFIGYRPDCQTCFTCELECPKDAVRVGPLRKPRPQAW